MSNLKIAPHPYRTARDGDFITERHPGRAIQTVVRRRTEQIVRPNVRGSVRLADPRTLREDQWRAAVDAQAARMRAAAAHAISEG